MSYILVIWTTVAMAGAGSQYTKDWKSEKDWRTIGEFSDVTLCENAAKSMAVKSYRCLKAK